MRRIRLDLSYDGSQFCGWQIQPQGRTVQNVVEQALRQLLKEALRVTASGRTDAGVHAECQVCHFDTQNQSIPPQRFAPALNGFLPPDIRVLKSELVTLEFHARFSATKRLYHYRFYPHPLVPPLWRNCCWGLRLPPMEDREALERLNELASLFVGRHDFTAFCSARDQNQSKIREVTKAHFFKQEPFWIFEIEGNAFLWNMVRCIVGTILEYFSHERGSEIIKELLDNGDRKGCGTTAPPRGLSLVKVEYGTKK